MTRVEVAIIGAGFAGIGMARALLAAGRESFVVLERADAVGGTWRDNTYPGVACDVPSHLYGYADLPNPDWSGVFARGHEIQAYLASAAEGLGSRLRLRTNLIHARWAGDHWRLEVADGGTGDVRIMEATSLVLACGRLTAPKIPDIPGLTSFPGPLFHSARWDHTAPIDGARVAVIGHGASAVQLAPELARRGAEVTLFQRTPAWIVPRAGRDYSDDERRRFAAHPDELAGLRADLFDEGEARYASRSGDLEAAATARAVAVAHLESSITDPALRAALTPDYAFGCKRVLLSDDFYPAIASGAVTLEPSPLASVDGPVLVSARGRRVEADVLVLATGFEAARQPYAHLVEGETGQTLAEHWSTGMTSAGSTLVHGFPGLFVLNGPNASLGHNSAVLMMEAQSEFVLRCLDASAPIRVPLEVEAEYTAEIVRRSAATPWVAGGCRNWYLDERSRRLTLLWPGTVQEFRERLERYDPRQWVGAPDPLAETIP